MPDGCRRWRRRGGNQEAAMMSGLNVKLDLLLTYVISGVGCALGAIILSSRLQTCHPTAGHSGKSCAIFSITAATAWAYSGLSLPL